MPSVQNVSPDLALSKMDEESKKIHPVIKALDLVLDREAIFCFEFSTKNIFNLVGAAKKNIWGIPCKSWHRWSVMPLAPLAPSAIS